MRLHEWLTLLQIVVLQRNILKGIVHRHKVVPLRRVD